MIKSLKKHHYFDGKIKKGFLALITSKSIIRIAGGLLGVFLPVFLYQFFNENIILVIGWYIAGSIAYAGTVAIGAIMMSKIGWRKSLRIGSFFGAVFFITFYLADKVPIAVFIGSSLIFLTAHRIFHWVPYHVDFAKFTDKKNRGKELGLLSAVTNIVGVFAPLLAGFILSVYSFDMLFIIAIAIYLLSIIPLYFIPRTHEKFSWGYWETWRHFFSKEKRGLIVGHFADGAEQSISLVIWPIFIFGLLKGNYLQIGTVAAFVTGVTIIMQLLVGKYADSKFVREKFLKFGSIFYSIGWILKIFVITAFHIFIADAYHRFIKIFTRLSFDVFAYEVAADEGHLVDEITVISEVALHIGKILMLSAVILLSLFFSINMTFILAAIASILINFIRVGSIIKN